MAEKNPNTKFKKMVLYGVAAQCSLIFLSAGFGLQYLNDSPGEAVHEKEFWALVSHISNEAGVAFIIAIVLAFTIERLTFEEFREMLDSQAKAIKENVYNYLTEHNVPSEISDEIKSQILKEVFVRHGLTVSYTIEPVDDKGTYPDYVRVSLTLTYKVENLTSGTMPFEIKHTVERSPEPSLEGEVKFISIEVSGNANNASKKGKRMRRTHGPEGRDLVLTLKNVLIHPGEAKMTTVTVKSQTIKHLKGGMDYHVVRHHTCHDIDVRVHTMLDLAVWAGSVSHIDMKEQEDAEPEDGTFHWKAEHPLLAGQNIYVTWMPKEADAPKPLKHAAKLNGDSAHRPQYESVSAGQNNNKH